MFFRLIKRNQQILKFAVIGVINTAIHASIVMIAVEAFQIRPWIANTLAFIAANLASYAMNSKYTFHESLSWFAYCRFLAASMFALTLTVLIAWIAEQNDIHYLVSLILVILLVPVFNFLILKYFVFSKTKT